MTLDSYNIFGDEYLFNMPLSPIPKVLLTFDGMQSAPTQTTPTLTPTTLRTIEETIFELTSEPQNVPFQAGFKPPPLTSLGVLPNNNNNNSNNNNNNNNNAIVPTTNVGATLAVINANPISVNPTFDLISLNCASVPGSDTEESNGSWHDGQLNDDQSTTDTSSAATDSTSYQNGGHMLGNNSNGGANSFSAALAAVNSAGRGAGGNTTTSNSGTPARRGGGRRPNKATNMSPEEEEKRRVRRERNKLAAARCRKRRVDQTNELTIEVDALVKKGEDMRKEIESLNVAKNQLEYMLQSHRPTCQKIRDDILNVVTCNGLIGATALHHNTNTNTASSSSTSNNNNNNNSNSNNNNNNNNSNSNDSCSGGTITGFDATLNSTGRSNSPLDLKPVISDEQQLLLQHIKHEPHDGGHDSSSSLDQDGPTPAKRFALPNIATLNASLLTPTGSLNTPITSTAPVGFGAFAAAAHLNSPTLNAHAHAHALNKLPKPRPNTLNVQQRGPFGQLQPGDGKAPTQIQGVPIQTPSTGTFNFDSLMDGGTGLTPVSGPLVPTCSSQNKHPLELPTPTSEPSKLVSL